MTPRTSVVAIDEKTGYHEALNKMTESGYSEYPFLKKT